MGVVPKSVQPPPKINSTPKPKGPKKRPWCVKDPGQDTLSFTTAPHLAQLLAGCLELSTLAKVLHALVLGKEILLLGLSLVPNPLVKQLAGETL